VGVNDVRSAISNQFDELMEGSEVISQPNAASQTSDTGCRDVLGLGFQVVGFIFLAIAGNQPLADYLGVQSAHQFDYLDSWAANVHSSDNVHHLDG